MGYIKYSKEYMLEGVIGDSPDQLYLRLFVDAGFCNDRDDAKSNSGIWLLLCGPNTSFPLQWLSQKQSNVSHSTTEAELVSLDTGYRIETVPVQDLWQALLNRVVQVGVEEDNQACIKVVKKGYSKKLRHINKYHKVNLASLKQNLVDDDANQLNYIVTDEQAADIFTKSLAPAKWPNALKLLNIVTTHSS